MPFLALALMGVRMAWHRQGEDNQGGTVVIRKVVQLSQQPAEGDGDNVTEVECENHWLSSLYEFFNKTLISVLLGRRNAVSGHCR